MQQIDPQEMTAAKTEVREAMTRRYAEDGRSKESVFGAMTTVLGELLGEMVAYAAKDKAHRQRLIEIVGVLVASHAEKVARKLGK